MEQYEFETKIKEMLVDVQEQTLKECIRFFNSGAIDPKEFESGYILPKMILYVALREVAAGYKPIHTHHIKQAKNLEYF